MHRVINRIIDKYFNEVWAIFYFVQGVGNLVTIQHRILKRSNINVNCYELKELWCKFLAYIIV